MKTALTFFWDEVSQIPKTVKFEDQAQAILDLYNKAKQMEKEQIIKAYLKNHLQGCWMEKSAEEYAQGYYNETFKSE